MQRTLIRTEATGGAIRPILVFLNVQESTCIGEVVDIFGFPLFQARDGATFSSEVLAEVADLLNELAQ